MSTSTASEDGMISPDEMKMTNRILCFQKEVADACFALGNLHSQLDLREDKAAKLYQHACDTYNHASSCHYLGDYFFFARGELRKDTKKFLEYATKGCDNGSAGACALLAAFYHPDRTQIPFRNEMDLKMKDFSKSVNYYDKACEYNQPDGCVRAGLAYLQGADKFNFNKDEAKALPYFIKACERGNENGCGFAHEQYKKGLGVKPDEKLADLFLAKFKTIMLEKRKKKE